MLPARGSKAIILTTLIDLLIQFVFIFVILFEVASSANQRSSELVKALQEKGITHVPELNEKWNRLVDLELLEKRYKDFLEKETQLQNENNRMKDILKAKEAGIDAPPCWRKLDGKPDFIFTVDVRDKALFVTPSWPSHRTKAVSALPVPFQALEKPLSLDEFRMAFQRLRQKECVHFVTIVDHAANAPDRAAYSLFYLDAMRVIRETFYFREVRVAPRGA